jgi:lysophospholipase L1-like esterase
VDARIGRSSTAALPALDESLAARHEVVVFDIATNDIIDPPTFRSNLRRVWNRIGDRELVLVTTWIVCCPDTPPGPVNRAIENFADLHPRRITVAEWDDVARAHPDFFSQDGIHLTAAGYARRVAFIHRKGQAAGFRAPATGQVEDGP